MTSHLVSGRPMPDWVAGHPALEFCNTMALWDLPAVKEYLTDHEAAVIWAQEHDIITAAEARSQRSISSARQASALRQLRQLRAGLYYAATAAGPLDVVHGYVARAVSRAHYRRGTGGDRLHVPVSNSMLVDRIALEVHDLLTGYGTRAVGRCASDACGWVFLDPAHRRRWCTMAICGNRAKAKRFAARTRTLLEAHP